ncbi:MAG: hypothetical protein WD598_05990 [Acidimicrobiia bacterium]
MPDPLDEAFRASDQADAAGEHERQQQALADATDQAGGRVLDVVMGGAPVTNFFEFLLILLLLMGVAMAALVWVTIFGDDEPAGGEVPGHHHDDGSETPTFNPRGAYIVVVPADRINSV